MQQKISELQKRSPKLTRGKSQEPKFEKQQCEEAKMQHLLGLHHQLLQGTVQQEIKTTLTRILSQLVGKSDPEITLPLQEWIE